MSFFCKHDWKVKSETTTKSKFQSAMDACPARHIPWQMACAERKFIQIVTCTKCGKLKRFVESI